MGILRSCDFFLSRSEMDSEIQSEELDSMNLHSLEIWRHKRQARCMISK